MTQQRAEEVDLLAKGDAWGKPQPVLFFSDVLVIEELPGHLEGLTAGMEEVRLWDHQRGIEISSVVYKRNGLLVGQEMPHALAPLDVTVGGLDVTVGGREEPFAVRTRLGWMVSGPMGSRSPAQHAVVGLMECAYTDTRQEIQVRNLWELEVFNNNGSDEAESLEDKRVLALWSTKATRIDGKYQFPMPFRKEPPTLPDNKVLAERRLMALKKRLARDETLLHKLHQ